MSKIKEAPQFRTFGFLAGIISTFLFNFGSSITLPASFPFFKEIPLELVGPGLVFGLAISAYAFLEELQTNIFKLVIFTIASTLSYIAAYFLTFATIFIGLGPILGGGVGACFMLIAYQYCIRPLHIADFLLLVCLGAALGGTTFLTIYPFQNSEFHTWFLFICWQTGMAWGLGWVIDSRATTSLKKK